MRSDGTNPRPNTLLMKEDGGWSGGNDVEGALAARRMTHHVIRSRGLRCSSSSMAVLTDSSMAIELSD